MDSTDEQSVAGCALRKAALVPQGRTDPLRQDEAGAVRQRAEPDGWTEGPSRGATQPRSRHVWASETGARDHEPRAHVTALSW